MAMMQQQQQKMAQQQQQQMQREGGDAEMNGRPGTPAEGDNGGSPSKRPRLEGQQQFNGGMMPNGRPMPNAVPQGMMIQNGFNPQAMNPQFRPNGGMPGNKAPMQVSYSQDSFRALYTDDHLARYGSEWRHEHDEQRWLPDDGRYE